MGIREALAAEGNAPIVFMGGTSTGPKWRERLCQQVGQSFRWFNPIVSEWTEEAKETELAVRGEADVILYAITPYQEGCYSYLEMTEDAIRSEKVVVVAFLPSFEDKAFSEQQWSSIVSAKRLLERNNVTVLLSMEELIDWFNQYNDKSPDGKLLDTQALVRKAEQQDAAPPADTPKAPVTAAGLVNAVQEERAQEFSQPAQAEPGTSPATGNTGAINTQASTESFTVSQEGIFDGIVAMFKGYNKPSPGDEKDGKKLTDSRWAQEQRKEIEKTFANPGWVKHNYHPLSGTIDKELACRLSVDGKVLLPAQGVPEALRRIKVLLDSVLPACKTYAKALSDLEDDAQTRIKRGEDAEAVAKDTLDKAQKIPYPLKPNLTSGELMGGYVLRYNPKAKFNAVEEIKVTYKEALDVPDLTEEDVVAAGKALLSFATDYAKLHDTIPFMGSGCDSGVWENDAFGYDSEFGEELYDEFYFQSRPDSASDFTYSPLFMFCHYLRDVGRWLQMYTK